MNGSFFVLCGGSGRMGQGRRDIFQCQASIPFCHTTLSTKNRKGFTFPDTTPSEAVNVLVPGRKL